MENTESKYIAALIVVYNGLQWLERCLDSLETSETCDIYVLDNGSTDGSREYLLSRPGLKKLVLSEENLGFGGGNNYLLSNISFETYNKCLLVNQDVYWEDVGLLKKLSESISEYDKSISTVLHKNADYNLDRNFKKNSGKKTCLNDNIEQWNFVNAAFWLVDTAVFESIGCFDTRFPHYGEDSNFVVRAEKENIPVLVNTSLSVIHDRGERKVNFSFRKQYKRFRIEYLDLVLTAEILGRDSSTYIMKRNMLINGILSGRRLDKLLYLLLIKFYDRIN